MDGQPVVIRGRSSWCFEPPASCPSYEVHCRAGEPSAFDGGNAGAVPLQAILDRGRDSPSQERRLSIR
jgi:hypothetical protein